MRKPDGLSAGLYPKLQPSFAFSDAVKRRAKLSGAYLADYRRALAWAAWQRLNGQQRAARPPDCGRDLPRYSRTWLR